MKPRESRQKVLIKARMRSGPGWQDACILNISSRGLLLQAAMAPPRGSYLEVGRGPHLIVARVVWSSDRRFGVRTQDQLAVSDIIDPAQPAAAPLPGSQALAISDRRSRTRSSERNHEESRRKSGVLQFSFVTLLGASAATIAFDMIQRTLAGAMDEVEIALAAR